MSQQEQYLDFATWRKQYRPASQHNTEAHSEVLRIFECFGKDLQDVEMALQISGPHKIWTLLEFEGEQSIVAGFVRGHTVGYLVTQVPWMNDRIQVSLN